MTDNEIIKALECCKNGRCDDRCPFYGIKEDCEVELPEEALDLINRQQAEIERLKEQNVRLNKECDHYIHFTEYAKSEAIKEFAEKLKDSLMHNYRHFLTVDTNGFAWLTTDAVDTHIDNLVKEMLEGDDNG